MAQIPIEIKAAIIGTLTGVVGAFLVNVVRESMRKWRRKRNIASAFVYLFRLFRRHLDRHLTAAKEKIIIFDSGYPEAFYISILPELPDSGPDIFLSIRVVFAQLRQVNYLKEQLRIEMQEGKSSKKIINLRPAYIAACKQAICAIDNALEHLRKKAQRMTFQTELPEITELSELEKQLFIDKETT